METKGKERIVVIGGGFAGINFVKHIDKGKYHVTLVDRNNYHSFPPLFYQIASSGLDPDSICFPFRREFHKGRAKGAEYRMGDVERIDMSGRVVITQFERIPFDRLVIAAGTTNNFFGNDKLIERVYTIKSTAQAMRARDEILSRLERASICNDREMRRKMLSFTVVGGGPAGVEIAGAIGEMKKYILKRNYPSIPSDDVRILLLEGSDRLLGAMSEKSQEEASRYLHQLMVEVRLGHVMKDFKDNIVTLDDGDEFYSGMLIWTAGVTGTPMPVDGADVVPAHGGRLEVDEYNRVKGSDGTIYAIGDICLMSAKNYEKGHPQLAQVAIQQGRNLAKNLNEGSFVHKFAYHDKGTMATVGRNRAVADVGMTHLSGFVAWMAWMFVHLMSILGMRNKINVLINWIWNYCSYATSLRILLSPSRYPLRWRWGEK